MIVRSYRVHQEQIRFLKDCLKIRYGRKPRTKERGIQGDPPASGREEGVPRETVLPSAPLSPADGNQAISAVREKGEDLREGVDFPHRCRECGEPYPLMDHHYTQETGLCIACWEEHVI